jgi:hypothetical protein
VETPLFPGGLIPSRDGFHWKQEDYDDGALLGTHTLRGEAL